MRRHFPLQTDGTVYLTEGGQETEIMYRFGHALPEFAMFPLLDQPQAVEDMTAMYQRYLDVAVAAGVPVMMGGLDYRASPDWGAKLGYSPEALASMQLRCIDFLRNVAEPYRTRLPAILISAVVGPRGDAYSLNHTITADSAEAYHFVQLSTLAQAGVDLITAMTFNSVPEAIGVARAAARLDLALGISFTLDSETSRLKSGPTLREAVEATDHEAGDAKPDFYGVNCSHPFEFMPALEPGAWVRRVRMLRPNASAMDKIALCKIGHLEEGDPEALGKLMGELASRYPHIDIWGGCCGTWDKHLEQIVRQVKAARCSEATTAR